MKYRTCTEWSGFIPWEIAMYIVCTMMQIEHPIGGNRRPFFRYLYLSGMVCVKTV